MNRIKSLDTLKGLMIFFIVIYHTQGILRVDNPIFNLLYKYGGDLGNTFFFMVSGFFITATSYEKVLAKKIDFLYFFKHRILKIYPMYFFSSLCCVVLKIFSNADNIISFKQVILNVLLITSGWIEDVYPFNFPCWFLSVLILMYIVWFIATRKYGKNAWYVYIALIIAGLAIEKMCLQKPFLYYHTGEGLVPFFAGCLLFKVTETCQDKMKLISICSIPLMIIFAVFATKVGFDKAAGEWKYVWYFLFSPALICIAMFIRPIKVILENKYLFWCFGNISMVVYLWHSPFTTVFGRLAGGDCRIIVGK